MRIYCPSNGIFHAGKKKADPVGAAATAFNQDFGPKEDPYIRLVYPSFERFAQAGDGAFGELAEQLFGPMLALRSTTSEVDEGAL